MLLVRAEGRHWTAHSTNRCFTELGTPFPFDLEIRGATNIARRESKILFTMYRSIGAEVHACTCEVMLLFLLLYEGRVEGGAEAAAPA